jgi:acyl dehydratase
MAIRGEYTEAEKKLLAEERKLVGKTEYAGEEAHIGYYGQVNSRVADRDLIRRYAQIVGDENPLWVDEEYAKKTKYGRIIAPPFIFHGIAIGAGASRELHVPPSMGRCAYLNLGCHWQFFKPVYADDSFKVKDVVYNSIEDKTRLDGKGPRQFLSTADRTYINQKDEAVCTVRRKIMSIFVAPPTKDPKKDWVDFSLPQDLPKYEYTDEETAAINRTFQEEERRGATPRYWEDVAVGDELKPVMHGSHNYNDQILAYSFQGFYLSSRAIKKESAGDAELETVINDYMFGTAMGILLTTFGTQMDEMMGHLITNWMGDDGFLKMFDSQNRMIDPSADANWVRGRVIKKYVENGEHLVDLAVWIESIRGWIVTLATATVVLPSKTTGKAKPQEAEVAKMAGFKVGDRVKIKDRPDWPGQYKLAGSEGSIIELQDPAGYVIIHIEKTEAKVRPGTTLVFRSDAVEKI